MMISGGIVMSLIVQKYGGSSVATVEKIAGISGHIRATLAEGHQIIAVISAMGDHTDELLEKAYSISASPPKRELDMLLTAGERVSMALLAIALHKENIPSISLTGSQCGILTDETHGNARILNILGDRIRENLKKNLVVIIAGFQGVNAVTKEITTLGRGGTDLSAIAIASKLGADACQLYKDVDGILTADPRIVPCAKLIRQIDWETMSELSWSGAGVLQHRAAHLAEKYRICVDIRPSSRPNESGTLIQGSAHVESPQVIAATHKVKQSWSEITFDAGKNSLDIFTTAIDFLWKRGEAPAMSREFSAGSQKRVIQLLADDANTIELADFLKAESVEKGLTLTFETKERNLANITLVGTGFRQSPEMIAEIKRAVPAEPILFEIQNKTISIAIHSSDLAKCLGDIHERFIK
jgi:aspartate kinase